MASRILILFAVLIAYCSTSTAAVFRVDADSTAPVPDGQTWPTAYKTIQEGINAAVAAGASPSNPAEVWVREGVYTGVTSPVVTLKPGVHVYGGFAGTETLREERDWDAHETIIDGEDIRRCVIGADAATLDGFTITRGDAQVARGGGMYTTNSSPTVTNCTFSANRAEYGGGMYNGYASLATVTNCTFSANTANRDGGGMFNRLSSPTFTNCTFSANTANGVGGGMYNSDSSSAAVTNCSFSANRAYDGGGVYNFYSSRTFTNCTFSANTADRYGGGMYNGYASLATVTNCTFSANTASSGGGMWCNRLSTVTNCILWGDSASSRGNEISGDSVVVTYSCIEGGYDGEGNISDEPLFTDPDNGDYSLQSGSPCIDAGTSEGAPDTDILGVRRPKGDGYDMGAYEYGFSIVSPVHSGQILVGDSLRFGSEGNFGEHLWDFGDGRTSSLEDPGLVTFSTVGEWPVILQSLDSAGEPSQIHDSRTISVVADPGAAPDLSVVDVQTPNGLVVGQSSNVTYSVRNIGDATLSSATWVDAVWLSQDRYLDTEDTLLASVSVSQDLAPEGEYQGSIDVTLPAMEEGAYYLLLSADSDWQVLERHQLNNEYAVATDVLVPVLENGVDVSASFPSGTVSNYYRVDVQSGYNLFLTLASETSGLEVYVSLGTLPSRGSYDYCLEDSELLIPAATEGVWYILVYGQASTAGTYTINARTVLLKLMSVTPNKYTANQPLELTLKGAGFIYPVEVELEGIGKALHEASSVEVDSYTTVRATFGADTIPPGTYTVRVTRTGLASDELADALEVVSGGEPNLKTNLIIPSSLGFHALATFYVEYANAGEVSMAAPLLVLGPKDANQEHQPILTLDRSRVSSGFWTSAMPEGFSTSVQFMAGGEDPWVLEPGESSRVPVYFAGILEPWNFSNRTIEFNLGVLTADDDTAVDWAALKNDIRPSYVREDAWEAVWANFTSQAGSTWGDYAQMLAENAVYLKRVGERVDDVSQLLALEFRQADGLSPMAYLAAATDAYVQAPGLPIVFYRAYGQPISRRYEVGPLGRDWTHNWQFSVTEESDGTVTITDMTGTPRIFQPDSRYTNAYLAATGDHGVLTSYSDGHFTLKETDGTVSSFDSSGRLAYVEDTNGNRITCGYSGGLLTSLTHSEGQFLEMDYNGDDAIARIEDSDGRVTSFTYSAGGRLAEVQAYDGRTTTYAYLSGGDATQEHALSQITFPGGTHKYFTYDAKGRLASVKRDSNAEAATFAYDSTGTVTATDALGNSGQFCLDNWGRVVRAEDALHRAVLLNFDDNGDLTDVTDSTGRTATFEYDRRSNLIRSTDPVGNLTRFTYTSKLNRLAWLKDANGNQTKYTYDDRGNLLSITYPDSSVESWAFDSVGNPETWTNRRNTPSGYACDVDGKLTRKDYADGSHVDYTYDARGNLIQNVDAHGTTVYSYDSNDYLSGIDYPGGQWLEFTYDAAGRRASSLDQLGHRLDYAYDAVGRLQTITDETGAAIVQYAYDAAGRLSLKTLGNGVYTTYEYDEAGQLLDLVNYKSDNTVLSYFDYTYDARGQRTGMATHYGTWSYEYDDTGQLTHAVLASTDAEIPNQDLIYAYDALGNRIYTIINGVTENYVTNNMNQYTQVGDTTYSFDADGNMILENAADGTTTYTYDAENRQIGAADINNTWTYTYDALDNRVTVDENGALTQYVIDPIGLGNTAAAYNANGTLVSQFNHGFGLVNRVGDSGNAAYYCFDALGNVSELTNQAGEIHNAYAYRPFGETLRNVAVIPNPFQFVGEWGALAEASGLSYMRARYYDPTAGRFVAADPIGIAAGDDNLYRYVHNSPAMNTDPTGLVSLRGMICAHSVPAWYVARIAQYFNPWSFIFGCGDYWGYFARGNGKQPTTAIQALAKWHDDSMKGCCLHFRNYSAHGRLVSGFVAVVWQEIANFCGWSQDSPEPPEVPAGSIASGGTGVSYISDPNQKTGPGGYGDEHFIAGDSLLPYRVDFENDSTATAPAQVVYVSDMLSSDLDWSTFELTEIGFGDTVVAVPSGLQYFETTVPMTYEDVDFEVQIEAGLYTDTGEVFVNFYSIDPETELPPSVEIGFLPPENDTGRGQGHFSYVIRANDGLASGTEIRNVAEIQFSFGEVIATNQVDPHDPSQGTDPDKEALVTIDAGLPSSEVSALPAETNTLAFQVSWTGEDDTGGSGIAGYEIYAQDNGGEWQMWLQNTAQTSETFTGDNGHTYAFYSIAIDNVGHRESAPEQADTSISVELEAAVPDLTGKTEAEALDALTSTCLTLGTVTEEYSETVSAALVISQTPTAGSSAACGSAVDVVVSLGPCRVSMPNVVGQDQAAAEVAIAGVGLAVGSVVQEYSETVAAGLVIGQNPVAETSVACNSSVGLVISLGPCLVSAPNVIGQTQAAAEAAITGAGLTVGTVTQENSETVTSGQVISQDPAAGTSVACNSAVNLVISLGPCRVTVPNVVGQTQAAAETAITAADLTVGAVTEEYSETVPAGRVISQDPGAGTNVCPPAAVDLVVSSGPVSVPNVVGMTLEAAEAAITSSGLIVGTVTQECSVTVPAGQVISQDPGAGTEVCPPAPVDLVVSSGPVSVPNVVGMTLAEAEAAIVAAGLAVGVVTEAYSPTVPVGDVISQDPAGGSSVLPASAVNLVVSKGPEGGEGGGCFGGSAGKLGNSQSPGDGLPMILVTVAFLVLALKLKVRRNQLVW